MDAVEVLRTLTALAYAGVGVLGYRLWRRTRSEPAGWVALAFGLLGASVLVRRVLPAEPTGPTLAVDAVTVAAILAFPYLLYRFGVALHRPRFTWAPRAAAAAAALVVGATVVTTVFFPAAGQDRPAWWIVYLIGVLAYWTVLAFAVAVPLWRAGRRQPTPIASRLRTLSLGALTLSLALLVAGLGAAGTVRHAAVGALAQAIALGSAGLFAIGFAPPPFVRAMWRGSENQRLRAAEEGLMAATTSKGVGDALLPPLARLLGGASASLFDHDGELISTYGPDPDAAISEEWRAAEGQSLSGDRLVMPLHAGWVLVRTSPHTPLFGADELRIAESLATLIDLALSRVNLHEQERASRLALERANEELQALLYGISHDLRNPLITVLGFIELLRDANDVSLGGEGEGYLDRIDRSAHYMDELIRDLLELSRVGQTGDAVEDVALVDLLHSIAEELQHRHPGLRVEIGPLPVLSVEWSRARQLFTNLLENAARHAGTGDVHVQVTSTLIPEGDVCVSVADDGVGVPGDYQERVFGLFERLPGKEPRDGTGIGLAICQRIVQQWGGTIRIRDASPGADVQVVFPASLVRAPAVMKADG
jgi:signal transduction histidine kinase